LGTGGGGGTRYPTEAYRTDIMSVMVHVHVVMEMEMEVHGDFKVRRGVIIICPSTSLSADERASVSTNIVIVGGHAAAAARAAAWRLPLSKCYYY
jgi:hypothetical protein